MKTLGTLALVLCSVMLSAQSLPFDFETMPTTEDFVDFDGGTGTVIANPQMDADNPSAMVAQIVRDGGEIWAGSKVILDQNLDFSAEWNISMKVFCTAPVGTIVKFKLEGGGNTEVDQETTVSGAWETLTWSFYGAEPIYNEVVFMFDFGNVGDGSETSTFLFDDVTQQEGLPLLDLPVNFDEEDVDYTMTAFGGTTHSLVPDPDWSMNMVAEVVKDEGSAGWAGTTIGTPAGFANYIPLTMTESIMSARVWSPDAGIPIRLKVEDALDPTHTCETEIVTTTSEEWEIVEFDFTNEAPGTAALQFGLDNGWQYNMASIFFNFGTDGAAAGEKTYLFDDVMFGEWLVTGIEENVANVSIYPNPTTDMVRVTGFEDSGAMYQIIDGQGRIVQSGSFLNGLIEVNELATGNYVLILQAETKTASSRISKL